MITTTFANAVNLDGASGGGRIQHDGLKLEVQCVIKETMKT